MEFPSTSRIELARAREGSEGASEWSAGHAFDAAAPVPAVEETAAPVASSVTESAGAVTLLIGPKETKFIVHRHNLLHFPHSLLGTMFSDANRSLWEGKGPHRFLDRDPFVFSSVAAFYETGGELTPPSHHPRVYREYDFWRVEPPMSELIPLSASRGAPLDDYFNSLCASAMNDLADDFVMLGLTGTQRCFCVAVPSSDGMHNLDELARLAKSPSLFESHNHDGCDECAAGRVTHFWRVKNESFVRKMLELRVFRLQQTRIGASLPNLVVEAVDGLHDSMTRMLLLSGNKLFQHRLRVACAMKDIEIGFNATISETILERYFVRMVEMMQDGGIVVWQSDRFSGDFPPKRMLAYTVVTLTEHRAH